MKRLYVGGLSHTISEKDLRDRFGKFGEVSDVEIITRKDEHGKSLNEALKCIIYKNFDTATLGNFCLCFGICCRISSEDLRLREYKNL